MRDFAFVIPSLGRPGSIGDATLKNLEELGIPKDLIHVFVADDDEKALYQKANPDYDIVTGELGIGNQRRFINEYFPKGTHIVSLDDDVTLIRKNDAKVKFFEGDLLKHVNLAYDECEKRGVRFWSVVDTSNGFFMKEEAVYGLRSCAGSFFGEYAQEADCQSVRSHCEDIEKLILHYIKYGGIIRFNNLSTKQKRYGGGGVIQHLGGMDERLRVYEETVIDMVKIYPDYIKLKKNADPKKGMYRIINKTAERFPSVF